MKEPQVYKFKNLEILTFENKITKFLFKANPLFTPIVGTTIIVSGGYLSSMLASGVVGEIILLIIGVLLSFVPFALYLEIIHNIGRSFYPRFVKIKKYDASIYLAENELKITSTLGASVSVPVEYLELSEYVTDNSETDINPINCQKKMLRIKKVKNISIPLLKKGFNYMEFMFQVPFNEMIAKEICAYYDKELKDEIRPDK